MKVILDKDGSEYQFDGEKWLAINTKQEQKFDGYLIKQDSGEYLQAILLQEDIKLQGDFTDTKILIPHHTIVIAVNIRVLEEIKGAQKL